VCTERIQIQARRARACSCNTANVDRHSTPSPSAHTVSVTAVYTPHLTAVCEIRRTRCANKQAAQGWQGVKDQPPFNSACSLETEMETCHQLSLSTMRIAVFQAGCARYAHLGWRAPPSTACTHAPCISLQFGPCCCNRKFMSCSPVAAQRRCGVVRSLPAWIKCRHHNDSGKCRVDASCGINVVPAGGGRGGW
jgi:hypothetical protein